MRDGDGKNFKIGFEDWDIIGQGTASLTTIAAVVKKDEGDKYVASSLVLTFIHTFMKNLGEHGSIKNPCFVPPNPRCDERLQPKDDESTCLTYTGLIEELEYLKIDSDRDEVNRREV